MSTPQNQTDELAGIAARGASALEPSLLEEQIPSVLPDIRLPEPQSGAGLAFSPRTPLTTETLPARLAEERARMAPFLADISPAQPTTRCSLLLPEAEWKLEPAQEWQHVKLPHYGGPTGRARAWYRLNVELEPNHFTYGSLWLCFGGVDYKAAIFFNGELVGTHEGFFSPFEFEVTRLARPGKNELLVRVDNDAICMGNNSCGDPRSGDKIYGATGLGWDEPGLGWHHCPPGMGIHRPVRVEARPAVHISNIFVRPLVEGMGAEVWIEVFNPTEYPTPIEVDVTVHGQNFSTPALSHSAPPTLPAADAGVNRYRVQIPIPEARLWSPETPWLYRAIITLRANEKTDTQTSQFGMRSFVLDESVGSDGRRGRFLLNGHPIRLRGANTMGHEQQCVFRGDLDQLRDDILLGKICHLNFLRFTQRPVETEVYDLCDRLGMMTQTDLPLFAYLRRNQFSEAVRQSAEMERLVRGHASSVLVSFINEPFPAAWGDKSHRHLTRTELLHFFEAASRAVWVENPDRQIKPIDGDYEPPGPGLPDSHCYAGWYNGHGTDLGKLHKGFWVTVKPGWNYACGEFGAEGLESEELMRSAYPPHWLPTEGEPESAWTPERISRAQTGTHHYLWLEPGASMAEWIERSQAHQAWITRLMTESFRRNNHMVSFAIHLFIDAWPAGWMKTIMDCRRQPKPAYFAFREALTPLAVSLRLDRTVFFSGEEVEAEVWVCNDTVVARQDLRVCYQLERDGKVLFSGRATAKVRPVEAVFQGSISFQLPTIVERETYTMRLGLVSQTGAVLHDTQVTLDLIPRPAIQVRTHWLQTYGGKKADALANLGTSHREVMLIDDPESFEKNRSTIETAVNNGATAVLLEFPPGEYEIAGTRVRFENTGMEPRHFVSRNTQHEFGKLFRETDFRFWFDPELNRVSPLLHTLFFADETWTPILNTGQGGWGQKWQPALAVAEKKFGQGKFIVSQVTLAGRLINPAANLFARLLLA